MPRRSNIATRRTGRFDWGTVKPSLVRLMLQRAYLNNDNEAESKKVDQLTPQDLVKNATAVLGSPPKEKLFKELAKLVRDHWLEGLSAKTLRALAGDVAYALNHRNEQLDSRSAALSYLSPGRPRRTM